METLSPKENCSDDEIFFGKLSIKEIKKHIFLERTRQTISSFESSQNGNDGKNDSFCLIETHSEPDIYSVQDITNMDLSSNADLTCSPLQHIDTDVNMLEFKKNIKMYESPKDTNQLCNLSKDKSQIMNESYKNTSQILYESLKDTCQLLCDSVKDNSQVFNEISRENCQIFCKTLGESSKNTSQQWCKLTKDTSQTVCKSPKDASQTVCKSPKDASEILDSTPDVGCILSKNPQKDCRTPNICNGGKISSDIKSECSSEFVSPLKSTDSDESFLKLENMVSRLCTTPKEDTSLVLNNTLDVVDYILHNKPPENEECITIKNEDTGLEIKPEVPSICIRTSSDNLQTDVEMIDKKENIIIQKDALLNGQEKQINLKTEQKSSAGGTQCKNSICTPVKLKQDHVFKTPKPLSCQKASTPCLKKTPGKSNAYQHITSPIASYIKNCPQAPLFKKVDPKKPLPGVSAIPKLLKTPVQYKTDNKENVQLPPIAYKSAKKTEMISVPDKAKIPKVQWIKKLTTSLPKPAIIKHDHRHMNALTKPQPTQEDSFANLTLHQAELSVCTKKSAF